MAAMKVAALLALSAFRLQQPFGQDQNQQVPTEPARPSQPPIRRFVSYLLFISLLFFPMFTAFASPGEINTCKYLIVSDFTSDPYGIANELRVQGNAKGFVVVSAVSEVSQTDLLKTCVMRGSWARDFAGGELSVRVVEAPSGALIAEASANGSRMGVTRTVRWLVEKIYSQLGYTGYSEEVNHQRRLREYPARPKVPITEDEIKKGAGRNPIEGIWTDTEDHYRLGIVAAPSGTGADYVAVVLRSSSPVWQPTEIKAEIRSTASPDIFTCTYFMADKKPAGTTLTLEHNNSMLRGSVATPKGPFDLLLMRVWPKISDESASAGSADDVASGTGFLLSRSGLVATNWHVVADAKNISVAFPGWSRAISAEVVVRDVTNDLAVLRVTDATKLTNTCPDLPFQLESSTTVTLGEHVSAIGYPLTPMLGSNPKFSEGVVSSKSGWQDDPRTLQVSAQVQPGSSGSPLFDGGGNIIGVVVATLDAGKVYQAANAILQNVNFAIKSDYLMSLAAMLPSGSLGSRTTAFSPEKAAQCVAVIRAW